MGHCFVGRKLRLHLLGGRAPQGNEGTLVTHGVAVVGRGEYCDALSVVADLVTLVLHFVAAHDVVHAVRVQEVLGDVGTELAADPSLGRGSSAHGLRVAPEQLAHDALLRRLAVSLGLPDIVQCDAVLIKRKVKHTLATD